jgi:branched-chain amino acid transport system substrate-binding protein
MHRSGAAACVVVAMASAACSSAGHSNPTPARSAANGSASAAHLVNVKIGVLTDLTGPAASGDKTFVNGIRAGVVLARRQGYDIKYVVGDAQTSPTGALSAAQRMVTRDGVPIVLTQSALTFAAAPYLKARNIPVIGIAEDASEWGSDLNMFPIEGALHTTSVTTTFGQLFKLLGGTTIGSLGYGISPSSSDSAKAAVLSAQDAGLAKGYLNANFTFGSTNVQPIALAMKNARADAVYASVDPNTGFALVRELRQIGARLKAVVLPDGYGADTLQAGPGALADAQNVYFSLGYEPVEMKVPETKAFVDDLRESGTTGVPTFGEYNGYVSVGLLLRALKSAPAVSSAALMTTLSGIHDWDALGLWGGRKIDINDREHVLMTSQCSWVTKLVGSDFQLVPGADPICGKTLSITTKS